MTDTIISNQKHHAADTGHQGLCDLSNLSSRIRNIVKNTGILALLIPAFTHAGCEDITQSTASNVLTDNGDNTITDTRTSLMWKMCSEGQNNTTDCNGNTGTHTWQQALQIPADLNASGGFAGHSDWRLPNVKELRSIVEISCHSPAINSTRFPNTPSTNYWTSSISTDNDATAWRVEFLEGESSASRSTRSSSYAVRLVRDYKD